MEVKMNMRKILSTFAAFLGIAALAAVAGGAISPAADSEPAQPAAKDSGKTAGAPSDAEMEALIQEKLQGSPHTLSFIFGKKFPAEKWSEVLDRMIEYGARINAEEKQQIINWLVSR
jgi:uncharacterized protein YlzI (FlbEa/FlbD family)